MVAYTYPKSQMMVDGHRLDARSIHEDGVEHLRMTKFEGAPRDFPHLSSYGEECMELTRIGATAVREVRKLLRFGPTNNKMSQTKGFLFGNDEKMAHTLNCLVEGCWANLKDSRPKTTAPSVTLWHAATYAASCRKGQAGVCAAISWVTMGVVSQIAWNTMACVYYNAGSDHSYVLIRKRWTPWFVVDPWVREPRICPWRYNHFGASGGNSHYFDIMSPVTVPLGQPIDEGLIEKAYNKAGHQLGGWRVPHGSKIWGHTTNVAKGYEGTYPAVCTAEEWGEEYVSPDFRVESLWA